jgi:SNF family Na+-dependent transporter
MWAAFALVVIACGGTAFMVRFLIALLREGSPSLCYWVIPVVRRERGTKAGSFRDGFGIRCPNLAWSPLQVQFLGAGGW